MIIFLTGCTTSSARVATERYLNKYKALDSEVLVDMESIIEKENLKTEAKEKYRSVLKKQYKDLSFVITGEEFDDNVSYVTTRVTVYDLYKAQKDASLYLDNNKNEFLDENGNYDEDKYINYKLDRMMMMQDRIEYTIIFTVTKEDNEYVIIQPTENDLKKIHGIYNYELN